MTKKQVTNIISTEPSKRRAVMAILKTFEGESFTDAIEVLKICEYYISTNSYFDIGLAEDILNADAAVGGGDE